MSNPEALAVFASGSGTNLQSLLDTFGTDGQPDPSACVALVVSDRPSCGALDRARSAGAPIAVVDPKDHPAPEAFAAALLEAMHSHRIELIALAGYLRLIPPQVVEAYRGRIVNIHPAPLPAFGGKGLYGQRAHRAVIEAGVRVSGPTIHFVDERYDTGPIIVQWPVPVRPDDTPERLGERVLRYEHRLYPIVVRALARGEVRLGENGRVEVSGNYLPEGTGFAIADEPESLGSIERLWSGGRPGPSS